MIPAHINACLACRGYAILRSHVVAPALLARRLETGETNTEIVTRYMIGVHDRHLAGLPILPESASR
jgi:hypothetical protein